MSYIYLTDNSKKILINHFKEAINNKRNVDILTIMEKNKKRTKIIDEVNIFPIVLTNIIIEYLIKKYYIGYLINKIDDFDDTVLPQYELLLILPFCHNINLSINFVPQLSIEFYTKNNVKTTNFLLQSFYNGDDFFEDFNHFMKKHYNKKNYFTDIIFINDPTNRTNIVNVNNKKMLKRIIIMIKIIIDTIQYEDGLIPYIYLKEESKIPDYVYYDRAL